MSLRSLARAVRSAWIVRACESWLDNSESCWDEERLSRRAAARADQAVLGAERFDLRLGSATRARRFAMVVAEPGRGVTGGIKEAASSEAR